MIEAYPGAESLYAKGWLRRKSSVFGSHGVVRIVALYRNLFGGRKDFTVWQPYPARTTDRTRWRE